MEEGRGLQLKYINMVVAVAMTVVALLLVVNAVLMQRRFVSLNTATEAYIAARQDAADMQAGSDYLTAQLRVFVVTGDLTAAENYRKEVEETRRRELAVANMREELAGTDTYHYLENALNLSNELVDIELHAMRLAAASKGIADDALPAMVREAALTEAEQAMTPDEQADAAILAVVDETYRTYKNSISENVNQCTQTLIDGTRAQQTADTASMRRLITMQFVLICLSFAVAVAVVLVNNRLVVRPLIRSVQHIRSQEPIPEEGAFEMRFMARTYNEISEQTLRHREKLSYEATHDALTGLYNRSAYDQFLNDRRKGVMAFLYVDVDKFKSVNDTYGHEAGDKVLRLVADTLTHSFRSEDRICRIGGDEFVVLMANAGPELKALIRTKAERIMSALANPPKGVVPVSVSVGCAFGDENTSGEELYRNADAALYHIKENGKSGCAFYGEEGGAAC